MATRLNYALHYIPYHVRIKKLKLTALETRRLRGDLIEVFKINKGFEDANYNTFFKTASSTNLRGHSLKLFKHNLRLDTRKYFFSQRVFDMWNKLDIDLIASRTISAFKIHLNNYIFNQGLLI